jgi:hypothetical protein
MPPHLKLALVMAAALILTGCGNSNRDCSLTALNVTPSSVSADHTAAAPGNQVHFYASPVVPGKSCSLAACVNCWGQTWTISDPINVSISNNGTDNGVATCMGVTNGAVAVTATAPASHGSARSVTGTATLTCR